MGVCVCVCVISVHYFGFWIMRLSAEKKVSTIINVYFQETDQQHNSLLKYDIRALKNQTLYIHNTCDIITMTLVVFASE